MFKLILKRLLFIAAIFTMLTSNICLKASNDSVRASKYLATMQFDGTCVINCPETNFPHRIDFNTDQDANKDGAVNAEDALENLIGFAIGDSIVNTGRTGLPNRGPNDQRPAVYFNYLEQDGFQVYQYWHYYADNDWINNHEHDIQYYFVYEQCGVPLFILLSYHNFTRIFKWGEVAKDDGHPMFDVEAGSHGYQNDDEHDGVRIRYDGTIHKREGKLITPDSLKIPWIIFSNNSMVKDGQSYIRKPDTMFKGDPAYPFPNPCEYCNGKPSPWLRAAWDSVQMPQENNCGIPTADFEALDSGYRYVFLNASRNAQTLYWDFGDGTKDTGSNPLHRYDSAGTYEVCLSVINECREQADCMCQTIKVSSTQTSVQKANNEEPAITLAPNPVSSQLRIESKGKEIDKIQVVSPQGHLLKEAKPKTSTKGVYRLSVQEFSQRVLIIKLIGKNYVQIKKVLKRQN